MPNSEPRRRTYRTGIWVTTCMPSALDGGEWSSSCPGGTDAHLVGGPGGPINLLSMMSKRKPASVYRPTNALNKKQKSLNTIHGKYQLLHVSAPECRLQGVYEYK